MATTTPKGTTALPNRKITYGAAVNAFTGIGVWALNTYYLVVDIPAEQAVAIATVLTFVVQYFVNDKKEEKVER